MLVPRLRRSVVVKTPSGWTLTRASQGDEFGFDGSGNLTWTKDSSLRDFTVQGTSAAGRTVLSSYGTSSGRRVNLSYNGDSLVRLMDDPASGHHYYRYTSGRLTEYESPTGAKTTYGYDANGFLDEIVEPGGTSIALDVAASGKVHAITTTLPGGVPQTTSFAYTRRTYKTDVTAPDATRRTYAYDDDWRVTRHYDPDVVPAVTASGELRDLEDDYVGPNQTYALTVAADQPDGAGLRRLLVERSSGDEIEGEDVPCTTTPFDLVCPRNRATNLDVSFTSVPEGEQAIRAAAEDDEEHHATSDGWKVLVDKTPPTAASDFQLSYFDPLTPASSATINWNLPVDPDLPGGHPGSGVAKTEVRFRTNGGAFSSWLTPDSTAGNNATGQTEVSDGDLSFFGAQAGDEIVVEVRATDAVGNTSPVASEMITLEQQLEDPAIESIAVEDHMDEYGTSESVARAWMRVQDRSDALVGTDVSAALPSAYGGIWLDNAERRIKIGVVSGHSTGAAQQVVADAGLSGHTDFVTVANTQRQLEEAQIELSGDLSDLIIESLMTVGRLVQDNSLRIEVATDATPAERSRIDLAAAAADVNVDIVVPGWSSDEMVPFACSSGPSNYYCDSPLRGGVGIGRSTNNALPYHDCTAGFMGHLMEVGYPNVVMTAGHCLKGIGTAWYTLPSRGPALLKIGSETKPRVYDARGDVGSVWVTWNGPFANDSARIPAVLVNASNSGVASTTRKTNYGIRGVGGSRPGRKVCVSGATTGTSCAKIVEVGIDVTHSGSGVELRGMVRARSGRKCTDFGDSGSPVYKDGLARGILSSG